jgi:hypothetical protein
VEHFPAQFNLPLEKTTTYQLNGTINPRMFQEGRCYEPEIFAGLMFNRDGLIPEQRWGWYLTFESFKTSSFKSMRHPKSP